MAKERCKVCNKPVKMQIMKNTGYCCALHQRTGEASKKRSQ